jgi:hypothetical protein
MELISNKNLAEPITLNYHDALIFCRDNVCASCFLTLYIYGWEGSFVEDRYHIYCFKCKHEIMEGEYILKSKVHEVIHNKRIGEREMSDEPKEKMTTEQAIKDLGF